MNNKSKIFESIKINTKHKILDLCLSDLLDDLCKDKEFSDKLYKDLMKEDLLVEEEEIEENFLRIAELFKRDTLINFTDINQFKELPNLINNYGIYYIMYSV